MSKVKDRRVSAFKKIKLERKNKARNKKLERILKKKKSDQITVPHSVLITDEEKSLMKKINEETKIRTEEFKASQKEEIAPYIKDLLESFPTSDFFIEVIDYRDIKGTRSNKVEKLLKENNKAIYAYLSFYSNGVEINLSELENDGIRIIRDVSIFNGKKNICIFGKSKTGKFTVSKQIKEITPDLNVKIVKIPNKHVTPSELFRSVIDFEKVDIIYHFNLIYNFIDQNAIREFYKIKKFNDVKEMLKEIGSKQIFNKKDKILIEEGAKKFIKDIKLSKIEWYKHDNEYLFRFNTE